MSKAVKTTCIICCLCLIVCVLSVPANAAEYLDPSDYLVEVTAEGTTKTAHYSFQGLSWLITAWNSTTGLYEDYENEVFYFPDVSYKEALFKAYPFGGPVYGDSLPWNGVAFDVSDMLPGSPIDFEFPFFVRAQWDTYEEVGVNVAVEYGMAYYDSNGKYLNTIVGDQILYAFTMGSVITKTWEEQFTISGTIPAKAHYIVPYVDVGTQLSVYVPDMQIYFGGGSFDLYIDVNTVIENSNMMQSINNKLDELNNSLGDVNDKLDDILNQPEQEKDEASQAGKDALDNIVSVVPDHTADLVDAFSGLASSMSYDGTVAKIAIPAVSMPGIDGLFEGFVIMQPQELDFEVYFDMLPEDLLLLVQSLFTAALIVFCFKELYSTIQYCLTLRG